ncbi:MAG: hypothetical protein Q4P18_07325 [Methanobrevibacter sp.]|nr:hypothetical protein [Methanobrevibacter sp.]MDO5849329.1 hypothetical protein [Methanobrevibacter sp.]
MMNKQDCDGCCYNNNPQKELNCNRIVCCYAYMKKGKFYECLIGENND